MSLLKDYRETVDRQCMFETSAPRILFSAGIDLFEEPLSDNLVEDIDLKRAMQFEVLAEDIDLKRAAQFEKLAKGIDEELASVRQEYDRQLDALAREKAELQQQLFLADRRPQLGIIHLVDEQLEKKRFHDIACAGPEGLAFLLELVDGTGGIELGKAIERLAVKPSLLHALVHLASGEAIRVTVQAVEVTEIGRELLSRLTKAEQ
ncbi:MAG: hypothetical protein H7144_01940 [Burkholderiales bacterium]|nr:hypothetical protein [Phycisphaerae bacterium]